MKKLLIVCTLFLLTGSVTFAQKKAKKEKNTYVSITTDYGVMTLMLYNETPQHRDNFIQLTKSGMYDSTLFHRVIRSFMIQGGDPTSKNAQPDAMLGNGEIPGVNRIPSEFNTNLVHKKGALAAARDNNPQKASSNCQFYIVQGKKFTDAELDKMESRNSFKYTPEQREVYKTIGGTPHLDNNYTVFGELVEGWDVLDKIASVKTGKADRPLQDVRMTVKLTKYKPKKVTSTQSEATPAQTPVK